MGMIQMTIQDHIKMVNSVNACGGHRSRQGEININGVPPAAPSILDKVWCPIKHGRWQYVNVCRARCKDHNICLALKEHFQL